MKLTQRSITNPDTRSQMDLTTLSPASTSTEGGLVDFNTMV